MRDPQSTLPRFRVSIPAFSNHSGFQRIPSCGALNDIAISSRPGEICAASAKSFLESLRNPDAPHGEEKLQPLQVAPRWPTTHALLRYAADRGTESRGFATPTSRQRLPTPPGAELAVAEAFWPEGLQTGLGEPVVLELDPDDADLPRLEELGYKIFTSADALLGFVDNESAVAAGEQSTEADEQTPSHHAAESSGVAQEFARRMTAACSRALTETDYNPTYLRNMMAQLGPVETARKLLAAPAVSDEFAALWERGRMDLTVEALVVEPDFSELFTQDEIHVASRRLEQFGYFFNS